MAKPRVIKDYEKLPKEIQQQVKKTYPFGFEKELILFKNIKNKYVSALPFEGEEFYYLIRMTKQKAQQIINDDIDYDDDGVLKKIEPPSK